MGDRFKAEFTSISRTYLYFEVPEDKHPSKVLDELLESGELQVPAKPADTEDFEYDDLVLEGWYRE